MFESLFGAELPTAAKFFIAFVVVLGLIALTAWLVRRFGNAGLGSGAARGRQPRLAVIDATAIDGRRRLVLIRRDNIEHLLMIGGPTDVVVEPNIVRAVTRDSSVRGGADSLPRTLPEGSVSWPLQPSPEPAVPSPPSPVAARAPYRSPFGDDSWTSEFARETPVRETPVREPAPRSRPAADSLTGMAADFSAKFSSQDSDADFGRTPGPVETFGRPAPTVEPVRRVTETEQPTADRTDHNLAEMASRLEAALRRPPQAEGRPPVTDPLAVPVSQESAPRVRVPEPKSFEPKAFEPKPLEPKMPEAKQPPAKAPEVKAPSAFATPAVAPEPKPAKDPKASSKAIYDNLEQEMASLLGRPATKQ